MSVAEQVCVCGGGVSTWERAMVPEAEAVDPSPVICPLKGSQRLQCRHCLPRRAEYAREVIFERKGHPRNMSSQFQFGFRWHYLVSDKAREKGWPMLANSSVTQEKIGQWVAVST